MSPNAHQVKSVTLRTNSVGEQYYSLGLLGLILLSTNCLPTFAILIFTAASVSLHILYMEDRGHASWKDYKTVTSNRTLTMSTLVEVYFRDILHSVHLL